MQALELAGKIQLGQVGQLDNSEAIYYPHRIDLIYSSPLLRAKQTAEILRRDGKEIIIDPRLKERSVGEYEGLTPEELTCKFPKGFLKELYCFETQPPGGESIRQAQDRVSPLIDEIREENPDKSILIVTHSIISQAIYYYLNPQVTDRKFYVYALKNCGIMPLTI